MSINPNRDRMDDIDDARLEIERAAERAVHDARERERLADVYPIEGHPSFKGAVDDLKSEARDFLSVRMAMFRTEMKQKANAFRVGLPMVGIGVVGLLCAFVLLNLAIVAAIANAFGNYILAWCWGALIVGGCYAILGAVAGFMGYKEIARVGILPERTMRVLKQDQNWIEREARSQA